ncbi:MAG: hypothetical protein Q4A15_12775 [Prevotellaceae bacterium]|nr:hypothetical protein [Prevotellaceae bacterium]
MINDPRVQSNPMAQNALNMYRNHDTEGLKKMTENLCKEYGTSVEEVRKNIGI